MEEKKSIFKSSIGTIIIGVTTTLLSTFCIAKFNGCFDPKSLSKEEISEKISSRLEEYSNDLNKKTFDAYKYFAPNIERFYQMLDTSPKKINDYVNGLFYKQFQNSNMYFDKNTLSVREIDNSEYDALIIMYSNYYNVKEKKQYTNYRTRTELRFDKDFHIKYFRQFFD